MEAPLAVNKLADLCKKITDSDGWIYACTDETFVTIDNALRKAEEMLLQKNELEKKLAALEKQLETKAQEYSDQTSQLEQLTKDLKDKQSLVETAQEKLIEAKAEIEKQIGLANQAGQSTEALKNQLSELEAKRSDLDKTKAQLEQEKTELSQQVSQLQDRIKKEAAEKAQETQNCKDLITELNKKLTATTEAATKILG